MEMLSKDIWIYILNIVGKDCEIRDILNIRLTCKSLGIYVRNITSLNVYRKPALDEDSWRAIGRKISMKNSVGIYFLSFFERLDEVNIHIVFEGNPRYNVNTFSGDRFTNIYPKPPSYIHPIISHNVTFNTDDWESGAIEVTKPPSTPIIKTSIDPLQSVSNLPSKIHISFIHYPSDEKSGFDKKVNFIIENLVVENRCLIIERTYNQNSLARLLHITKKGKLKGEAQLVHKFSSIPLKDLIITRECINLSWYNSMTANRYTTFFQKNFRGTIEIDGDDDSSKNIAFLELLAEEGISIKHVIYKNLNLGKIRESLPFIPHSSLKVENVWIDKKFFLDEDISQNKTMKAIFPGARFLPLP